MSNQKKKIAGRVNLFRAVGWFINHYFFVIVFRLEEKENPKISKLLAKDLSYLCASVGIKAQGF